MYRLAFHIAPTFVLAALVITGPALESRWAHAGSGAKRVVWRDLLVESSRAELDSQGLFIDMGTADQHKYTRGGWKTGWGARTAKADGPSYARMAEPSAQLSILAHAPPLEIVVRARARAGDPAFGVALDGTELSPAAGSSARLTDSWRVYRFQVPAGRAPGAHRIRLRSSASTNRRAYIDWVWVRTGASDKAPSHGPRVGPLRLGKRPRRALLAPSPRSYSFYLHVPENAALSFFYGAASDARFSVSVLSVDGVERTLFDQRATPDTWRQANIDLANYAGGAVRLTLATSGANGKAGFGQPALTVPADQAEPRQRSSDTERPRNVLLVVYDTTRADLFSPFSIEDRVSPQVAPNYESLVAQSTTFVHAYNNESWTRPSTISILTGLYPSTHGALYSRSMLDTRVEMLSEHLQRNGVQTFGIVGNSVLGAAFGLDQGWDEYREHGHEDNDAARIFGEATEWIGEHHDKGPFFVYIQSHDSHTPYAVDRAYTEPFRSAPYRGRVGAEFSDKEQHAIEDGKLRMNTDDRAWIEALYRGEAKYQDEHFGALLERMDELGILDDTLVVVTNDHGEEFGEHQVWGHAWTLYDHLLRAPLLIRHPGFFPAGVEIEETIEHVDLAPTIVDALRLPPMRDADGMSLLPLITGRGLRARPFYAVAELRRKQRAIHVGHWKLIADEDLGQEELYDIRSDPGETHDLADRRPIAARLCEIYLGEALASPKKSRRMNDLGTRRTYRAQPANLDAQTKRTLETLGYLGQDNEIREEEPDQED